ncbi:hypothetical protein ACFFHH_04395 [Cytobacillus solani]|uniref:hypothetical protein n=1 Tax=Cytobacillus solani TaxID=1637975 RepID=UPI0006ABB7B2|nr:hypothetical protein [Cytobacillus solani]KOP71153.1 hypothetical protein AMS60_24200 [Bacillus sp. FJAT-21945]USK55723.1 hypothetical protein LIS82_04115 [Cytobacillus solani]
MTLVLDKNLAHRIEQSEVDALSSRLSAIQGISGNPMDVQIEKFGNAASVTIPDLRNKGVHQALIDKRLQQAAFQACDLAVGQAKYASISQNNMERAGLQIAYTKAIWVQRES